MKQPLGVILAGGQATRMGGGDKGLLQLGGQSVLGHVIERLTPQVDRVALNANGDAARFAGLKLRACWPGWIGPLNRARIPLSQRRQTRRSSPVIWRRSCCWQARG